MYPTFVRDAIESAYNYYNYAKNNKTSRTEVKISEIQQLSRDTFIFSLAKKLTRPDSVCLCIKSYLIESDWYAEKDEAYINPNLFEIQQADMVGVTITIKIKNPLLNIFNQLIKEEITVVSDLKFLIRNVMKWYQDFGDRISLPGAPRISAEEIYFRGEALQKSNEKESREQKKAVKTALSEKISYIWGAPGTGKTQYVLADCLLTYIKRGERVLVLAPTHNAIEQTLSAVIKTMEAQNENINCIYRLGIPTSNFAKKYPGLCDRIDRNATIESITKEIELLNTLIFDQEKNKQIIKNYSAFSAIYKKIQESEIPIDEKTQLLSDLMNKVANENLHLKELQDNAENIRNNIQTIRLRENSFSFKIKRIFTQKEALELIEKKQALSQDLNDVERQIKAVIQIVSSLSTQIKNVSVQKENLRLTQLKDIEKAKTYRTKAAAKEDMHFGDIVVKKGG